LHTQLRGFQKKTPLEKQEDAVSSSEREKGGQSKEKGVRKKGRGKRRGNEFHKKNSPGVLTQKVKRQEKKNFGTPILGPTRRGGDLERKERIQ